MVDPLQWAQPYIIEQCHLAAIPHLNTLLNHRIIWWTPTIGDYSLPPCSRPVSDVGKLCQPRYNKLRTSVIFLHDSVKKYQQSTSHRSSSALQPSLKWVQQVLEQLHSVQMLFCHIEFVVWDLQRLWLEIWAILDYMEIYKPCMDGHTSPGEVADTVGTITTSIRVAQDMFLAGLPCWLIRPSNAFRGEKISAIGQIFHPKDYVNLEPHKFNYPVIFKGVATDLQKYRAMEAFARNFLVAEIPLHCHLPPRHWPELRSLLPHPLLQLLRSLLPCLPLQLLRPVQPSVQVETLGGAFVGQEGVMELVSLQYLIYWYIIILNCFLKVLINHPVIMGVINSSRSQTSTLHCCRSLPGPTPWLLSMMIPLV